MSAIDELQAAVSRFGTTVGFGAVTASNTIDAETISAVSSTLQWIHANVPAQRENAVRLLNQLSADVIAQSASGLAIYLNQIANDQNLGGSNLVIPPPGSSGIPNWAIYLAVAVLVIGGGAWLIYRKRGRRRSLKSAMGGLPLGALEHHVDDDDDDADLADFVRGKFKYDAIKRARLAYLVQAILRDRGIATEGADDATLVALARAELSSD